jgi:hypothetical protein
MARNDEHRIFIVEAIKACPEEWETMDIYALASLPGNDLLERYAAGSRAYRRKIEDVKFCRGRWIYVLILWLGTPYDDGPEDLVPPHDIIKGGLKGRDVHPSGNTHRDLGRELRAEGTALIANVSSTPPLLST